MVQVLYTDVSLRGRLPVLACGDCLGTLFEEYGWFCTDRLVLPFVIRKKFGFRRMQFYLETARLDGDEVGPEEERAFLDAVCDAAKDMGADFIVQPPAHAVFRATPTDAVRAPCVTYRVDLRSAEDVLHARLHRKHRKALRAAEAAGIEVRRGRDVLEDAFRAYLETHEAEGVHPEYRLQEIEALSDALGGRFLCHAVYLDGRLQGGAFGVGDGLGAWGLGSGSAEEFHPGAMKALQWTRMLDFKRLGSPFLDFSGGVLSPAPNSRHAGIQMFKSRFGSEEVRGWLWKKTLRSTRHRAYRVLFAARHLLRRRQWPLPDVIEREGRRHGTL